MIEQKEVEGMTEPVLYRSEEQAFECRHLKRTPIMQPTEVLRMVETVRVQRLLMPHEQGPGRSRCFRASPFGRRCPRRG